MITFFTPPFTNFFIIHLFLPQQVNTQKDNYQQQQEKQVPWQQVNIGIMSSESVIINNKREKNTGQKWYIKWINTTKSNFCTLSDPTLVNNNLIKNLYAYLEISHAWQHDGHTGNSSSPHQLEQTPCICSLQYIFHDLFHHSLSYCIPFSQSNDNLCTKHPQYIIITINIFV